MGGTLGGYFDVDDVSVTTAPQAAISASWNANADGNWSAGSNWTGGAAPDGTDHVATFGDVIDLPRTVTLDAPKTLGTLKFSSPVAYIIAGDALTLDVAAGEVALEVAAGAHTISAPIVLSDNLTITSAASSGLAITAPVAATGQSIFKTGSGSVQLENVRASKLSVTSGLLRIRARSAPNDLAGTSVINSLIINPFNPGAQVDLANNSAVVDYTGPVGTLVSDLRAHLESGRLTSTSATLATGLGYGDNAVLARTDFAGVSVDSDSLLIKFTFFGDSDLDGDVDVADLGNLASAWQSEAPWTGGDFDYSGIVNVNDLGLLASNWQAGVNNPLSPDLTSTIASLGLPAVGVPEPGLGLAGLGLLGLWQRRRRVEFPR
jgi:MYXO-CTERM domain-containing protein